jgi:hypothetical protein
MTQPSEKLTKLDAAGRQLRQAIVLFLQDQDTVSVHTLAAAALQILTDIGKNAGVTSMVRNPELIRPEMRRYFVDQMNAAQNFFKHADRDAEANFEFYPAATPFFIIDAVVMYRQLTGESQPAEKAYEVWFALNYPDVLVDGAYKDYAKKLIEEEPTLKNKGIAMSLLKKLEGE